MSVWILLAVLSGLLAGCACKKVVEIDQNDLGNYVYNPRLVTLSSGTNCDVVFKDTVNVAAHRVQIRDPAPNPPTVVASGLVPAGGSWTWSYAKNTYAAGKRLAVSDPTGTAGGPHASERGTITFR
jgi:purine nucleoside permease